MKTATVRELRNHPSRLLSRISEGEEMIIDWQVAKKQLREELQ
jgi:hypothetical protein